MSYLTIKSKLNVFASVIEIYCILTDIECHFITVECIYYLTCQEGFIWLKIFNVCFLFISFTKRSSTPAQLENFLDCDANIQWIFWKLFLACDQKLKKMSIFSTLNIWSNQNFFSTDNFLYLMRNSWNEIVANKWNVWIFLKWPFTSKVNIFLSLCYIPI